MSAWGTQKVAEPQSLWNRVECNLRRPEVFTFRRLIGESVLERNASLWQEIDALEGVLKDVQAQNDELSGKLAARSAMPPALERTLLESHLRLLLGKLGVASTHDDNTVKSPHYPDGGANCSAAVREISITASPDQEPGFAGDIARRTSFFTGGRDPATGRHGYCARGATSSGSSNSAPASAAGIPFLPLHTPEDRAAFDFISAGGSNRPLEGTASPISSPRCFKECKATGSVGAGGKEGSNEDFTSSTGVLNAGTESRPGTGRRPASSRSARSAPESLESGRCLSVATVDLALSELRAAFEDEAHDLAEEVVDLTRLLADEAGRKIDGERRSGRQDSVAEGGGGLIPCSELRRYGKKLEEALRTREHVESTRQRLGTLALGGRRKHGGRERGRRKLKGACKDVDSVRAGGWDAPDRCCGDLPSSSLSLSSSSPSPANHMPVSGLVVDHRNVPTLGREAAGEDMFERRGPEGAGGAGVRASERQSRAARKLRGTVRLWQEGLAAGEDDEKFLS